MKKHTEEFKQEAVRTLADQRAVAAACGGRFRCRVIDAGQVGVAVPAL